MNGKSKCKILKDIRRQIAQNNEIEFVTSECKHQGDCTGTCPKCEAELRYLEQELEKRQKAGKTIAVAGIAAALVIGAAGCGMDRTSPTTASVDGDIEPPTSTTQTDPTSSTDHVTAGVPIEPMGDINPDAFTTEPELSGEPSPDDFIFALPGAIVAP